MNTNTTSLPTTFTNFLNTNLPTHTGLAIAHVWDIAVGDTEVATSAQYADAQARLVAATTKGHMERHVG